MKAIILASRKANRLLPLTKNIPQCLLKIKEKTILEIQIENLKKAGIGEIYVITGYLSEKIEDFSENLKIKTLFNPFFKVSGMAAALWSVKEELKEGFVFLYSDLIFETRIVEGLLGRKENICLSIKKYEWREEAEKVVEKQGIIKNISKVGMDEENAEFIGIAKFSKIGAAKLIEELKHILKTDLNASLINTIDNLIKKGETVEAYDIKDAKFIDIDFPEDFERAKKLFT